MSELGGPIQPSASGPSQPSGADNPDEGDEQPHEREQQIGKRAQEDQDQRRNQHEREPDQRQHARLGGVLVLILDHRRRHAADTQRPLIVGRQLVDSPLGVLNLLFVRVAQPEGGDRHGRAVGVDSGHRGERHFELRSAARSIDFRLRNRVEAIHLERVLDQERGRDNRIGGRQPRAHCFIAENAIEQGVHLGEARGREHLAAEDERDHPDLARITEELVDLIRRIDNGVVGGKEGQGRAFHNRRATIRARRQRNGNEEKDEQRDPRPGRDQPAQRGECLVHGRAFYPRRPASRPLRRDLAYSRSRFGGLTNRTYVL